MCEARGYVPNAAVEQRCSFIVYLEKEIEEKEGKKERKKKKTTLTEIMGHWFMRHRRRKKYRKNQHTIQVWLWRMESTCWRESYVASRFREMG